MKNIDLYYDFRSPYTYFAYHRLSILTDKGATVSWKPVSTNVLINLQAGRDPQADIVDPLCPPKRAHFMSDIFRLIKHWEVPFALPEPPRPVCDLAMIVATRLTADNIEHGKFRKAVFETVWRRQQDANNPDILKACLVKAGLPQELVETAQTDGEASLMRNTIAAYDAGIFGVPTFVLDDEVFFGADRMELLATYL